MSSMTTTLTGPGVPTIVRAALALYGHVQAGRWSAVVDLTADRFTDAAAAGAELDRLAPPAGDVDGWPEPSVVGDEVTFDGDPALLRSALDLYTRVLLGQFGELAWSTGNGALSDACNSVRATYQRAGAWPAHPRGSWSIAGPSAPREAQVAYDAWKLLGGGVAGRPLLTGSVTLS